MRLLPELTLSFEPIVELVSRLEPSIHRSIVRRVGDALTPRFGLIG